MTDVVLGPRVEVVCVGDGALALFILLLIVLLLLLDISVFTVFSVSTKLTVTGTSVLDAASSLPFAPARRIELTVNWIDAWCASRKEVLIMVA